MGLMGNMQVAEKWVVAEISLQRIPANRRKPEVLKHSENRQWDCDSHIIGLERTGIKHWPGTWLIPIPSPSIAYDPPSTIRSDLITQSQSKPWTPLVCPNTHSPQKRKIRKSLR